MDIGLASGITDYLLSLQISITTNTTICDFFMFEISDYKAKKNNYKTNFNEISYGEKLVSAIDNEMKEQK